MPITRKKKEESPPSVGGRKIPLRRSQKEARLKRVEGRGEDHPPKKRKKSSMPGRRRTSFTLTQKSLQGRGEKLRS